MPLRILLILLIVAGAAVAVNAQRPQTQPTPADKPDIRDPVDTSPVTEMKVRMAMRYAEKEHEENLERAREAARIGSELQASFTATQVLSGDDQKKVERIEKLVKHIRSDAGGSDGDLDLAVPVSLGAAIEAIARTTADLNKRVAATSRLVVSAEVIDQTNQLLLLVKFVRGNSR